MKEKWADPGWKAKQSQLIKNVWADPERKEFQLLAIGKGLNRKPNNPESFLQIKFWIWCQTIIYSGDYSVVINGKNPDFICLEKKKIIEFNGSYWHRNDIPGEHERFFAEVGYDTLILVDKDLLDMEALRIKIDTFMERPNPYITLMG